MQTNIFASNALKYWQAGYSVIPVNGKRAFLSKWPQFCERLPTQEEIETWRKEYPNANIAICMGSASGIIALDYDNDVAGEHAEIISQVPDSPVKKKGAKGFSAFYRYNSEKSRSFPIKGINSLDILSTGKACVIPPSWHPEGKPYVWLGNGLLSINKEVLPCLTI